MFAAAGSAQNVREIVLSVSRLAGGADEAVAGVWAMSDRMLVPFRKLEDPPVVEVDLASTEAGTLSVAIPISLLTRLPLLLVDGVVNSPTSLSLVFSNSSSSPSPT